MLCLNTSRLADQYREGVLAIAAGAVLIVAASASVAEAQYTPNIQGGGASLPAPTYRQDFNCYGMPLTNPPDPAADTGVPLQCQGAGYPIDSTKIFRYASVGSGRELHRQRCQVERRPDWQIHHRRYPGQ